MVTVVQEVLKSDETVTKTATSRSAQHPFPTYLFLFFFFAPRHSNHISPQVAKGNIDCDISVQHVALWLSKI